MMTKTDLAARLRNACAAVIAAEQELTRIEDELKTKMMEIRS